MKQKLGYFCWDTRWRLEKDLEQVWKGNKKEPWEALKRSFRVYEFLGNKKYQLHSVGDNTFRW